MNTKVRLLIGLLLVNAYAIAGTGYITTIENNSKYKMAHIKIVSLDDWYIYANRSEFDLAPMTTYDFRNEERRWHSGSFAIYIDGFYGNERTTVGIQKWGTDPRTNEKFKKVITFNDLEHYVFTDNEYIDLKNDKPGSPNDYGYYEDDYYHYYKIVINDTPLNMDEFTHAKVKNTDFRDLLFEAPICINLDYDKNNVILRGNCVKPAEIMRKGYIVDGDYTQSSELNYYKECYRGDAIVVDYTSGKLKCGS